MLAAALLAFEVTVTPLGSLAPPQVGVSDGWDEPASVVWTGEVFLMLNPSTSGGSGTGLQVTRMTADGVVLDVPALEIDAAAYNGARAACGDKLCLAVWPEANAIRALRFAFDGTPISEPFTIHEAADTFPMEIATDGAGFLVATPGGVLSVWFDGTFRAYTPHACPGAAVDHDGVDYVLFCGNHAVFVAPDGTMGELVDLGISPPTSRGTRAAWNGTHHLLSWSEGTELFVARHDANLNPVDAPTAIATVMAWPLVEVASDGVGWFVAWNDPPETGGTYGARVAADGTVVDGTPIVLHPGPTTGNGIPEDSRPGLAFGEGVWVTAPTIILDQYPVVHAVRVVDGVAGAPVVLSNIRPVQWVRGAGATAGELMVAWIELGVDDRLRARLVGLDGAPVDEPLTFPRDGAGVVGGSTMVWVDEDRNLWRTDIDAASLTTTQLGTLGPDQYPWSIAHGDESVLVVVAGPTGMSLELFNDDGRRPIEGSLTTAVVGFETSHYVVAMLDEFETFRLMRFDETGEDRAFNDAFPPDVTDSRVLNLAVADADAPGFVSRGFLVSRGPFVWHLVGLYDTVAIEELPFTVDAVASDGERWLVVEQDDETLALGAQYLDSELLPLGERIELGVAIRERTHVACKDGSCLVPYSRPVADFLDSAEVQGTLLVARDEAPDAGPGGGTSGDCDCRVSRARGGASATALITLLVLGRIATSRRWRRCPSSSSRRR